VFLQTWTDPELAKSKLVKTLHGWWSAHTGPAGIPDRGDFDLIEHRLLMPNVLISDVETEPFRIRYRSAPASSTISAWISPANTWTT
jgi:hypothetical protein